MVNDSDDKTPDICKSLGVDCLQNNERKGKCNALNKLVKKAKGEILFFLDSDSTAGPKTLKRMVPWFSKPDVGAVSPRWLVKNKKKNLLTRLLGIENKFNHNFFKTHMFFGSLISFRGCGVAIRRKVFEELGGWPHTLIEDADFSARLLRAGYNIQYEPRAKVKTNEPETRKEFGRQRFRWSKGSVFSLLNHRSMYKKSPQLMLYLTPYILLALAVIGFIFFQTTMFMLPFLSFYLVYTLTMKDAILLLAMFFIPLLSSTMVSVTTASLSHVAIMTRPENEQENRDLILLIPYILYFLPYMTYAYIRGIISGIRDKKNKRSELNLDDW